MPNFIKRLFKPTPQLKPMNTPAQSIQTAIPATSTPLVPVNTPKFKFDIEVYERDDPSCPPQRLTDVISESAETLRDIYATCNQNIKILRKIPVEPSTMYQPQPQVGGGMYSPPETDIPPVLPRPPFTPLPTTVIEPKYLTVGSLKLKIVGDVIFQKQWVRASDDEAKSFRVVSEKNNKLVSLAGRHIEIEKWIKVEE